MNSFYKATGRVIAVIVTSSVLISLAFVIAIIRSLICVGIFYLFDDQLAAHFKIEEFGNVPLGLAIFIFILLYSASTSGSSSKAKPND